MYRQFKLFSVFMTSLAILGLFLLLDTSVVSQADAQVVLTEVDYYNDQVEIVNMGASTVNIRNWQLCSLFSYRAISALNVIKGNTNLEPGGVLVLSGFALNDVAADLGLYNSGGDFGNPAAMESFVQWGSRGNGREGVAANKGIWKAGEFVLTVVRGHSIEYKGTGTSAGAWFDQPTPNFGTFGPKATAPSVVINEVDYRVNDRIEFKNLSPNSIDISKWWVCSLQDYIQIADMEVVTGSTNLQPGATVVVSGFFLDDTAADLGLYSDGDFLNPARMESFVQWGSSIGQRGREPVAVQKGIWKAGDFVPLVANGHSIEYKGPGTFSDAWFDQPSPTLGVVAAFGVKLEFAGADSLSTDDPVAGVTYTLKVTNTGNQNDTITLAASSGGGVVGVLSKTSVNLGASASETFTLKVSGDALTKAGSYQVTVIATSTKDNSKTAKLTTTTMIKMAPVFGVTLEPVGEDSLPIEDAIAGVTYCVKVTNTGNQTDTINLSVFPEVGIEGSVVGVLSQTSVTLGAGKFEMITLKVTGDAFTKSGDYEVTVTATSAGDKSKSAKVTTKTNIKLAPVTPWDVNGDGVVNVFDLVLIGSQFGKSGAGLAGDVNGDGTVNIFDLVIVGAHFGETTKPAAAPSALFSSDFDRLVSTGSTRRNPAEITASDRAVLAKLLDTLEQNEDAAGLITVKNLLRTLLEKAPVLPKQTRLLPNFPNPFNPETWMPYQLAEATNVTVTIYDAFGRAIRQFDLGRQTAGNYTGREKAVYWDGRDNSGQEVSSGLYFYTLKTDTLTQTRRMVIVK
ncbi:T9SS type A sorting domain-containing protein [Candidatus Poribacteria bacterium]|nr:T9SS type A sorting domain-containing protein [Candidatus Poribacteria bacterium]